MALPLSLGVKLAFYGCKRHLVQICVKSWRIEGGNLNTKGRQRVGEAVRSWWFPQRGTAVKP
jgi:hypothetical protein